MTQATVYIEDLRLKAIVGTNDWEREKQQEIGRASCRERVSLNV